MDEATTVIETNPQPDDASGPAEPLATEVLVEEVSIDGMCGVY
jgi:mycofactocin precursor